MHWHQQEHRLHYYVVINCIVMCGWSSAMTSSLHNGIHPPEMGINLPKMVCGCPCGGIVIKTITRKCSWNAFVNVQLHILGDSWSVQLGNALQQQNWPDSNQSRWGLWARGQPPKTPVNVYVSCCGQSFHEAKMTPIQMLQEPEI